jgi:hypothetical protein
LFGKILKRKIKLKFYPELPKKFRIMAPNNNNTDIIQWNSDATNSDVCFICDKKNEGDEDEDNICPDCDEKWEYDEEEDAYIPTRGYNTQTNPPYYCDGGCRKIVGEGWDHDCERVCPDCKEEEEEEEEEATIMIQKIWRGFVARFHLD